MMIPFIVYIAQVRTERGEEQNHHAPFNRDITKNYCEKEDISFKPYKLAICIVHR
jgi:hypothetical protein